MTTTGKHSNYKSEPFADLTREGFWCNKCWVGFAGDEDLIFHLTAHGEDPRGNLKQSLDIALATAFCAMQRSYDAGERQRGWLECLRLAKEIDKLNGDGNV